MTVKEARNVIEKYLKCRNEPCNDVRLCSECGLNTNESEQDEAFKLAIEALKCMSLNADMINADAMYKLFITGEMTMEDFKKMCGNVKAIETLSCSEIPNSCHGDKDINVPCKDTISRQDAIDAVSEGCQEWRGIFEGCKEKLLSLPSAQPDIIRCKDCKYWREHKYVKETKRYIPFCGFHAIYTKAEDFCSRAERRTDGKD